MRKDTQRRFLNPTFEPFHSRQKNRGPTWRYDRYTVTFIDRKPLFRGYFLHSSGCPVIRGPIVSVIFIEGTSLFRGHFSHQRGCPLIGGPIISVTIIQGTPLYR